MLSSQKGYLIFVLSYIKYNPDYYYSVLSPSELYSISINQEYQTYLNLEWIGVIFCSL